MPQLLAALDDSTATRPVVEVAQWFGDLLHVETVAIHVSENGSGATARDAAEAAGLKFEVREGEPVTAIHDAASDTDVRAIVLGARGIPIGRMPAGHVALDVIRRVTKPVVVVPPDAPSPHTGELRLLAPIDELRESVAALRQLLGQLDAATLDLVLLRVFDAAHMPLFANHEPYESEAWRREFAHRTVPAELSRTRVETRVGHPADTILATEQEFAPDLVVLGWARDLSHGHASVIKRLLARSTTPVALLPVCASDSIETTRYERVRR